MHSAMAVEKLNHPVIDCFTLSFHFHYDIHSATGLTFSQENKGQMMFQRKHICRYATKTGRGTVFPGHYPQVMVEKLETCQFMLSSPGFHHSQLCSEESVHQDLIRYKNRHSFH